MAAVAMATAATSVVQATPQAFGQGQGKQCKDNNLLTEQVAAEI